MTNKRRLTHPIFLFALLYFTLTISLGVFLVDWNTPYGTIFFLGFELLFVGLAYDLTELIISFTYPPHFPPRKARLSSFPRVALLVTICDDVFTQVLDTLSKQSYPNYDIFILDDSQDPNQQAIVDRYPFKVLRRGTRRAYKAGNLNNWLDQYGQEYTYFAVLDSDSLVDSDFLVKMVSYAEHPNNDRIAVFQSKILPWNMNSFLPNLLGKLSPLRMYILERVGNRMGGLRSFGHNNLLRTATVLEVGGFNESLTPEDTVLSIMLDAKNYSTALVDVVTYDTEPEDIVRFSKRTTRWAMQTVEVFRLPWRNASTGMKLSLHYNLYVYLRPTIYISLLLFTAWMSFSDHASILPIQSMVFLIRTQRLNVLPLLVVLSVMTGLWILPLILHMMLARKVRISMRDVIINSIFSIVITNGTVGHTTGGMLKAALGKRTEFTATNTNKNKRTNERDLVRYVWPAALISMILVIGVVTRNQSLLLSLNCLWIILLISSPMLIWMFGKRSMSHEL